MIQRKIVIRIIFSVSILFSILNTQIKAQGHYMGSSFNTNDYFIPASPGWVFSLYYSRSSMNYYNDNGDKTDEIVINQDPPFSVKMGQNVTTSSVIPMALYFGKGKVLNANWGFLILPLINNPNASIALDFYTGQDAIGSQKLDINAFGLGDFYLQPIWLTWEKGKSAFTFSYGTWMPIGKYKVNSTENVGLGYWSHNLRMAARHKVTSKVNISAATTFEINSKQKGVDFTEANHLTFDLGGSYGFTMGHEIGLFSHSTWQLGDDKGIKGSDLRDRIFGVGAYGSYWFIPGKLGTLGRVVQNFGTRNRYGGFAFQVGVNYMLFSK